MRVFVPVEDPPSGALVALLVPYQCGLVRERVLRKELLSEMWAHFAANDVGQRGSLGRGATDPGCASQVDATR